MVNLSNFWSEFQSVGPCHIVFLIIRGLNYYFKVTNVVRNESMGDGFRCHMTSKGKSCVLKNDHITLNIVEISKKMNNYDKF